MAQDQNRVSEWRALTGPWASSVTAGEINVCRKNVMKEHSAVDTFEPCAAKQHTGKQCHNRCHFDFWKTLFGTGGSIAE